MAPPITGATWLTRSALNSIRQKSLLIEIDHDFLAQIQKILPAVLAGFCVWTGRHNPAVWVKWHWYFDANLKQFVVPLHGIESNIALYGPDGALYPDATLQRHALRRIRRRHDWKPWLQLHEDSRRPRIAAPGTRPAAAHAAPRPPPLLARASLPTDAQFTDEDIAIIQLLRQGSQRKQIASRLKVSSATVDRRLASLRERLEVDSNRTIVEAAKWRNLI